jgi:predicted transcriptional regulator
MLKPQNPKHSNSIRNLGGRNPAPLNPLIQLRNHITDRDNQILGWLYDHHTLTTAQIAHALFPSTDFAQRRLLTLTQLQAVTRFRPNKLDGGSYPYHYVLDQLGFTYVMGERGLGLPRRDEARRRLQSVMTRPDLRHLLGANQFFIDLAGYARTHTGCALARWLPASAFHSFSSFFRWGDNLKLATTSETRLPRPDGQGIWRQDGRAVPFFLEYDTGKERQEILAEKIFKYATLQGGTTWVWPALFVLPSQRREDNLHHFMSGYITPPKALWYTTNTQYLDATGKTGADAVWRCGGLLREAVPGPSRLIDLPYQDPDHDGLWEVHNPHASNEELESKWTRATGRDQTA